MNTNIKEDTLTGRIRCTMSGNAYIKIGYIDLFIHKNNINKAFDNDLVSFKVINGRYGPEAIVYDIIERYKTEFVGTIQINNNFAFVKPDSKKMNTDFLLTKGSYDNIKNGDKVIVKLGKWKGKSPYGKIIKTIGAPGENETEIYSIMHEYELNNPFPEEVMDEANNITQDIDITEIKRRRDFRNIITIAIDPKDCRDRDDSLSYQELDNGDIEVGIHIADVTHYVHKNSKLDKEALNRGTSVYLVDRVIPMLPEKLSNDICSLNENIDKLSYSYIFTFDKDYNLRDRWFGRGVVNINKALSYEDAQYMIDNNSTSDTDISYIINKLNSIAKSMRNKREILEFIKIEHEFILDNNYKPIGINLKKSSDSNKLIEEFMLLANREVAEFIYSKKKASIYRAHDKPDIDKITELSNFIKEFGYNLDINSKDIKKELSNLLNNITGTNEENIISTLVTRTMDKAKCKSGDPHSHYGLGMKHYSWATSPIRRYADIVLTRILSDTLGNNGYLINNSSNTNNYTELELNNICEHINIKEVNASRADRDSVKFKQIEYLMNKVGSTFGAIITSINPWGLYCEIIENKCTGMINRESIEFMGLEIEDSKHRIINFNGKKVMQLGDVINIKIKKVSLKDKEIIFDLVRNVAQKNMVSSSKN